MGLLNNSNEKHSTLLKFFKDLTISMELYFEKQIHLNMTSFCTFFVHLYKYENL